MAFIIFFNIFFWGGKAVKLLTAGSYKFCVKNEENVK